MNVNLQQQQFGNNVKSNSNGYYNNSNSNENGYHKIQQNHQHQVINKSGGQEKVFSPFDLN